MTTFKLNFTHNYLVNLCTIKSKVSTRVNSEVHQIRPTSEKLHEIILIDAAGESISLFMTECSLWIVGFSCDSGNYFFKDYYDNNFCRNINGSKLNLGSNYNSIGTLGEFKSIYTTFSDFWKSINLIKKHSKSTSVTNQERLALARLIFAVSEALRYSNIQDKINEMARIHLNTDEMEKAKKNESVDFSNENLCRGFRFIDFKKEISGWEDGSLLNNPNLAIKHLKKI